MRCTEISQEGMKLELTGHCPQGTCGSVHLRHEDFSLKLGFRSLRSGPGACGILFVFDSEEQKDAVCRLVEALSAPRPCTSLAIRS